MDPLIIKWIHIISSTLLFGTGLGSAFYKWQTDKTNDLHAIVVTNRNVVLADWIFTTPTSIIQPITGVMLAMNMGYSFDTPWLLYSIILFAIAGSCWLPVVYLQIRMRNIAQQCLNLDKVLPANYWQLTKIWFWLGIPAFVSIMSVFYLMVTKPVHY